MRRPREELSLAWARRGVSAASVGEAPPPPWARQGPPVASGGQGRRCGRRRRWLAVVFSLPAHRRDTPGKGSLVAPPDACSTGGPGRSRRSARRRLHRRDRPRQAVGDSRPPGCVHRSGGSFVDERFGDDGVVVQAQRAPGPQPFRLLVGPVRHDGDPLEGLGPAVGAGDEAIGDLMSSSTMSMVVVSRLPTAGRHGGGNGGGAAPPSGGGPPGSWRAPRRAPRRRCRPAGARSRCLSAWPGSRSGWR